MCKSMTQQAKQLYREIQERQPKPPTIGLYHYSFWLGYVWIAYGERVYFLNEMSNEHLVNTLKSQRERHSDEMRWPLEFEYIKRKLLRKI